jgi:hypothetical protein
VSRRIVELYEALREDERLQKDWEQNQPREDRCLEAPLIVMTPREIATAALIWLKVQFEPGIQNLDKPDPDESLMKWAQVHRKDLCKGGPRLVKVIKNAEASQQEKWAALASLAYYRDRKAQNDLVRCHWSPHGLRALAEATVEEFQAAHLKVTSRNAPLGIIGVAGLLVKPPVPITRPLPKIPGVGEERSDAIGVFGFSQGWPITDRALWQFCTRHRVFTPEEENAKNYGTRNRLFMKHWESLLAAFPSVEPGEIAATLYLWTNEAERYGFQY